MDRYSLWGVQYGPTASPTVVGGIASEDLSSGSRTLGEPTSGQLYPAVMSLVGQDPTGRFTTESIKAALDLFQASPLSMFAASIASTSPLNFHLQKYTAGGGPASGSVHRKLAINFGVVSPGQLTCRHQGNASMDYRVTVGYDGSNNPIIPTEDQALPSGLSDGARYTLGPVSLGGVTLDDYTAVTIDFGVTVAAEGAKSEIWPRIVAVTRIVPTITIEGIKPGWFATTGAVALEGLAAGHANSKIYLRKRATGGTFVADETAEHISFTCAGMAVVQDGIRQAEGPAGVTLHVPLYYDGTNLPLVVNTATAIT